MPSKTQPAQDQMGSVESGEVLRVGLSKGPGEIPGPTYLSGLREVVLTGLLVEPPPDGWTLRLSGS